MAWCSIELFVTRFDPANLVLQFVKSKWDELSAVSMISFDAENGTMSVKACMMINDIGQRSLTGKIIFAGRMIIVPANLSSSVRLFLDQNKIPITGFCALYFKSALAKNAISAIRLASMTESERCRLNKKVAMEIFEMEASAEADIRYGEEIRSGKKIRKWKDVHKEVLKEMRAAQAGKSPKVKPKKPVWQLLQEEVKNRRDRKAMGGSPRKPARKKE